MDRKAAFNDLTHELLRLIGEDPTREGLSDTPDRSYRAWQHLTAGYSQNVEDVFKTFEKEQTYNQMVFQGSIPFYSLCEHHLLPFFGFVHIGYIPSNKIIGLSKFSRVVDIFSRRLSVQERITNQLADAFRNNLSPKGIGVVIQARHMCMESRGIQRIGAITQTVALRGDCLAEPECRSEFMGLVKMASDGIKGL
jgi:GTP cyclohydrolase I